MPDLQPGREEALRRLRRWLAFSERLDRLIEASEPPARTVPSTMVLAPAPARHAPRLRAQLAAARAGSRSGLRVGVATALARLALAVHRDAAVGTVPRPQAKQEVANA